MQRKKVKGKGKVENQREVRQVKNEGYRDIQVEGKREMKKLIKTEQGTNNIYAEQKRETNNKRYNDNKYRAGSLND